MPELGLIGPHAQTVGDPDSPQIGQSLSREQDPLPILRDVLFLGPAAGPDADRVEKSAWPWRRSRDAHFAAERATEAVDEGQVFWPGRTSHKRSAPVFVSAPEQAARRSNSLINAPRIRAKDRARERWYSARRLTKLRSRCSSWLGRQATACGSFVLMPGSFRWLLRGANANPVVVKPNRDELTDGDCELD